MKFLRGETSQAEFAKFFGINQNTIGRYERGERTPDAEFIFELCRRTGVNLRWFILGEGPVYDSEINAKQNKENIDVQCLYDKIEKLEYELNTALKETEKAKDDLKNTTERSLMMISNITSFMSKYDELNIITNNIFEILSTSPDEKLKSELIQAIAPKTKEKLKSVTPQEDYDVRQKIVEILLHNMRG